MANIFDFVTATEIGSYWTETANDRIPLFGETKFPNKKKLGLDLSWIKGSKGSPVMLSPSTFDAKVIPISRKGFEKYSEEMPFFKNSMIINEKDRQELNMVLASNNAGARDIILGRIFNDEATLLENASITREALRMQALTTGVISVSANGVSYNYNYGVPNDHKVTPAVKWDVSATADPIADINAWADLIENSTGVRPTEMLLNSVTFGYIQKANAVRQGIYANVSAVPNSANRAKVLEYVQTETGMTVYIYNKQYDNNGTMTKFVADGTVVLMPSENLGNTWFGTTPEESDLMSGTDAVVSIVDTGVAVTTTKQTDPVNVVTKVSEIVMPSFEMADSIIIASVKTAD